MSERVDLDELERLSNAATEGPWEYWLTTKGKRKGSICVGPDNSHIEFVIGENKEGEDDAEFIAAARTAVPALIAELREARAAIERVRAEHREDWSDWGHDHPEEGPSCTCGYNGEYRECPTVKALEGATDGS
jgi:hypothetical protein